MLTTVLIQNKAERHKCFCFYFKQQTFKWTVGIYRTQKKIKQEQNMSSFKKSCRLALICGHYNLRHWISYLAAHMM
jgi:hypothetical protein